MVSEIRLKGALNRFADEVTEVLSEVGPLPDPEVDYWFGLAVSRAEAAIAELQERVRST